MTDASRVPLDGEIRDGRHFLAVRVYYEDTDFTGIVYHANYLRYFERGRSDFFRLVGVSHFALLERQVDVMRDRPEVDYVITRVRFIRERGVQTASRFDRRLLESSHVANMPSALLIRRQAFAAVGAFRTDLTVTNDIDWFARAKDLPLTLAVVPEVLLYKRVHDANYSYNNTATLSREILELLRRSVRRQSATESHDY